MKRALLLAMAMAVFAPEPAPAAKPKAPADTLRLRMEEQMNPAFTNVSHLLFHAKNPTDDEVFAAAQKLEKLSRDLAHAPATLDETDPQFRVYATQLHTDARALLTTIGEHGERPELEHWFSHVRASCDACHSQFKDEAK